MEPEDVLEVESVFRYVSSYVYEYVSTLLSVAVFALVPAPVALTADAVVFALLINWLISLPKPAMEELLLPESMLETEESWLAFIPLFRKSN